MNKETSESQTREFIGKIAGINWFGKAGEPSEQYTVVISFIEAWDGWNRRMLAVWSKESHCLEERALQMIGDPMIDWVFARIAEAIGPEVEKGFCQFQDRLAKAGLDSEEYGLSIEIIDFIKRDAAWACIESILGEEGFFHQILEVLREGRWPCAWDGDYPSGRFVVM